MIEDSRAEVAALQAHQEYLIVLATERCAQQPHHVSVRQQQPREDDIRTALNKLLSELSKTLFAAFRVAPLNEARQTAASILLGGTR